MKLLMPRSSASLLQLPRLSDEDMGTRGVYVKLIHAIVWMQYWGSATGMFGFPQRWGNYDDIIGRGYTPESLHCQKILKTGA